MQSVYSSAFTYVFYMYVFIAGGLHSCLTVAMGIAKGTLRNQKGGLLKPESI